MNTHLVQAAIAVSLLCPLTLGQELKLHSPDAGGGDRFGDSVSISGSTAITGARASDENGLNSGSVHLFNGTSGAWIAKLSPSDGAAYDYFGCAVGSSGTTVIVGAYMDDDNGLQSGSAYLFDISDPSAPVELAKLLPSDGEAGDSFGWSVAISGTTAIVGAFGDDDSGGDSGSAYLFDVSDPTDPVEVKLLPSDGAAGDSFGWSVAISGAVAIVGAHGDDDSGDGSGSAYIFDVTNPALPVELPKLLSDDGAADDHFGWSVAISNAINLAIVGAYGSDDPVSGEDSGAAYLFSFDLSSSTASQYATYLSPDGATGDRFGSSVAISSAAAVVGAIGDDDNGIDSGSAYLILNGPAITKLLSSDGAEGDGLGSVAAIGSFAVMLGTGLHDFSGLEDSGSVYLMAPQDCNGNGVIDSYDVTGGGMADCNSDYVPDECQLSGNDCDSNGVPDNCDVDCDSNSVPDSCQAFSETEDCNNNGIPDSCDIADGTDDDSDSNGVPDSCEATDSGSSDGGDCFVATAAFGDYDAPEVRVLRRWRDESLARSRVGVAFIETYYRLSPPLAAVISERPWTRLASRVALAPVVGLVWLRLEAPWSFPAGIGLLLALGMISRARSPRQGARTP